MRRVGRHFLAIPGPSPVPDRVMRAIDMPVIDHRGPDFATLGRKVLDGLRPVFGTRGDVIIFPGSGTGAWEAALANTLSPGDQVLMYETGHFAALWSKVAGNLGLAPQVISSDWRGPVSPSAIGERLKGDRAHAIKAVCVVHNETSTGVLSDIAAIRAAIDDSGHPALFMVDAVSSLGSTRFAQDEWRVDVTVAASQKGLMLPPGLAFNAVSARALEAAKTARLPKSYWAWGEMLAANRTGYFPYTPATTLLYGLSTALDLLAEEGLDAVFARHERLARATRAAVNAWGLDICCTQADARSPVVTAILDEGADRLRARALADFDLSLGTGLGRLAGKAFRIGHLGDTNELTLVAVLAGVEMALRREGRRAEGGVEAAMAALAAPAQAMACV